MELGFKLGGAHSFGPGQAVRGKFKYVSTSLHHTPDIMVNGRSNHVLVSVLQCCLKARRHSWRAGHRAAARLPPFSQVSLHCVLPSWGCRGGNVHH